MVADDLFIGTGEPNEIGMAQVQQFINQGCSVIGMTQPKPTIYPAAGRTKDEVFQQFNTILGDRYGRC